MEPEEKAEYYDVDNGHQVKEEPDSFKSTDHKLKAASRAKSLYEKPGEQYSSSSEDVDEDGIEPRRAVSQSLCIKPEDMMFMIKDNDTGALYDIRTNESVLLLEKADEELTKIASTDKKKPWKEWWKQKRKNNHALMSAAENGYIEKVLDMLDSTKYGDLIGDINAKGLDGFSPLHFAAGEGHDDMVDLLISKGANVNALSSSSRTPLHLACIRGHKAIIELLVKNEAQLDLQDEDGNTPSHFLCEFGWYDCLKYLLTNSPNLSLKNKYGENSLEVSTNLKIRQLCQEYVEKAEADSYSRTVVNNVIFHNNRADMIKSMLFRAQRLGDASPKPEEKKAPSPHPETEEKKEKPKDKRRIIKILDLAKKLPPREEAKEKQESPPDDDYVGPESFDILEVIGRGSFGEVYLVRYKPTGKHYAMKVLNKRRVLGQNLVKYAMAERNVLCYIKHPFIVGLDFAFQTADKLFLLMEYCPGGDLGNVLTTEGKISEERARIYASEVLLALEHLHKRDIIFRDLKPENVVLDADGHGLLTDFGLSKEGIMDNQTTTSFCGSVAYLAPEMLRKTGHGKSVDWYLLGVLIHELVIGKPPFFINNKTKLFENILKAPLKLPTNLSPEICNLLKLLLNRNPRARLGSGKKDAEEIKKHPWFKGVDWKLVMDRGLDPPKPKVRPFPTMPIKTRVFDGGPSNANTLKGWEFSARHAI